MLEKFPFCTPSEGDNYQGTAFLYATFLSSVCIFLTLTAILGNSLILVALHKNTSLHPPSKLLLRCLTITDLCVGVIGQPLTVTANFSVLFERWQLCLVTQMLNQCFNGIFFAVSLLTITAISVDRLLALLLRLRYRQIVTVKRVRALVILLWLIPSVTGIVVSVLSSSLFYLHILEFVTVLTALIISTYSYTRIFLVIRRQKLQLQDGHGGHTERTRFCMSRYKKTVFNALWVHLTLVTSYLPFVIISGLTIAQGLSSLSFYGQAWALILVYFNSSLNPVLYCWRIKEIRQAVKETIRQFCTCFSS